MRKSALAALAVALLSSGAAYGADVYNPGSTKDSDIFGGSVKANRSGFYLNGALGLSKSDSDFSNGIAGEKYKLLEKDAELFEKEHWLSFRGSEDIESPVLGGGIGYLLHFPSQRFGLEVGVDGTYYTDSELKRDFSGFASGRNHNFPEPGKESDFVSGDETNGSFKFKRDYDIDLVAKGHLFINDRWSVYAGGGLSWARASAKGSHQNGNVDDNWDGPSKIYANSYNEDDSSLGYVLVAGTQVWLNDRTTLGAEYSFKKHEFDFGGASSATDKEEGYRRESSDSLSVDDEVHAIKAKIGIKLN